MNTKSKKYILLPLISLAVFAVLLRTVPIILAQYEMWFDEDIYELDQEKYASIRPLLIEYAQNDEWLEPEFQSLYNAFGKDLPTSPYLYAFHYEMLFGKDVSRTTINYETQSIFDGTMNERAKEKYNALSWTTLKYEEIQELLQDPVLGDLLKKIFE